MYGISTEYEKVVRLKTVAAYEFAAMAGALAATSERSAIDLCARSGAHLGWMAQILDDIEALWFPIDADSDGERRTFPVMFALTLDHPNARQLRQRIETQEYDRRQLCRLLDAMDVRSRLLEAALDHRDQALNILRASFPPAGAEILGLYLDWLLGDGARLLGDAA